MAEGGAHFVARIAHDGFVNDANADLIEFVREPEGISVDRYGVSSSEPTAMISAFM